MPYQLHCEAHWFGWLLEVLAWLDELAGRKTRSLLGRLEGGSLRLRALSSRLPKADTLLAPARQRLDLADLRLGPALRTAVSLRQTRLAAVSGRLRPDVLVNAQARARERLAGLDQRRQTALVGVLRVQAGQAQARRDTLTRVGQRLDEAMRQAMARRADHLSGRFALLHAVSYAATLARGYAIVRDGRGGLVRDVAGAKAARKLAIEFADGPVSVVTDGGKPVQASLFE